MSCEDNLVSKMKNHLFIRILFILGQSSSLVWRKTNYLYRNKNPFTDYLHGQQKSARLIPHVPFSDDRPEHANRSGDGWSFSDRQTRQAGDGRYTSDPILNGIPYGKTGYRRSATLYHIEITEENVSWLTIMTNGGSGDVDIYYKLNDYPTKSNYDGKASHNGNQEQITVLNPVPGRYYIVLYGYENYSNVGFEAEYR